jgi:ABC-2 type transport system permease protein
LTFKFKRALAIAQKEVYHIIRDPFTLSAAIVLPIFMVVIFGLAIEFNVKNIPLSVYDDDKTQSSRQLIESFAASDYFIINYVNSPEEGINSLINNDARAALIITPDFQRDLFSDRIGKVQILLDGTDSSTVVPISGYIGSIESLASQSIASFDPSLPYELRTRYLFNPELNSRWFVIPGLNAIIIGMISVLLTSLTVAREYENGSMELLLSTPIQPLEIILGKLAPYGILGLIAVTIIYFVARICFDVPFIGSHLAFILGAIMFLIAYLSQGLLISVITRNQLLALQMAMMTGLLPNQLLSGFIFPIESMPQVIQYFTAILPSRWFMQISRDSFLQGTSIFELWLPFLCLAIFCTIIITLGVKSFKRNVEP